jgi:ABC-2 type transport system permease protein
MPLWTALGATFMPMGIGFLIFVARNPELSQQLGLVSAKADLVAYSGTDWRAYLGFSGLTTAAGGQVLFILVMSWVFGREFADGTVKDLLAVPVSRWTILLAKFIVVAVWSLMLTLVILITGVLMGALIRLPDGSASILLRGSTVVAITACLAIAATPPFALLASVGRGYLLPIGMAFVVVVSANLIGLLGWAEYFPWAIPGLHSQGTELLSAVSYWIVGLTGLAGIIATHLWWKYADQAH